MLLLSAREERRYVVLAHRCRSELAAATSQAVEWRSDQPELVTPPVQLAGIASFVRIQRGGAWKPTGWAARCGGALLAAGGLLALAGCGQASRTSSAHTQR
jgi:hypothetical protein